MIMGGWQERVTRAFERFVVAALLLLLGIVVLIGVITLYVLFVRNAWTRLGQVADTEVLLSTMQLAFGGVLAVLLGIELMETIRRYDAEHHVRVEVVFFVGLIALGRHVIQTDFTHASFGELVGMAALILALAAGYFLVRRASRD